MSAGSSIPSLNQFKTASATFVLGLGPSRRIGMFPSLPASNPAKFFMVDTPQAMSTTGAEAGMHVVARNHYTQTALKRLPTTKKWSLLMYFILCMVICFFVPP